MPRGGARPNAGRRRGTANKRTREIADQAASSGITPLEVMLENMRFYHQGADDALKALMAGEIKPAGDEASASDPAIEALKNVLGLRKAAGEEAARAAPFIHARIAPIEGKNASQDVMPLAERLKAYATDDAIEASNGKVVAMKAK